MRPIGDAIYQTVLHRVEMNVIHVRTKIRIVANLMLPKSTLP